MSRLEIEECKDIEELKRLCMAQNEQLSVIGEILVSESKWHITSDEAIKKIRDYLVKHQSDVELRINEENENDE
jgi:deoxyhypusine synthase